MNVLLHKVLTALFIFAGNASRGSASFVLSLGVPPRVMPLAIGSLAATFASITLIWTDRMPGPSHKDIQVTLITLLALVTMKTKITRAIRSKRY
jgi:hypothetical protein